MNFKNIFASFCIAGFATTGLAQSGTTQLSMDQLKEKCRELTSNRQLKPFKVRVTCNEHAYVWELGPNVEKIVPNRREISFGANVKSFNVPFDAVAAATPDTRYECPTLLEYKTTVPNIDFELTCNELDQIQDFSAECQNRIEQRLGQDPNLQLKEPTGRAMEVCTGEGQVSSAS